MGDDKLHKVVAVLSFLKTKSSRWRGQGVLGRRRWRRMGRFSCAGVWEQSSPEGGVWRAEEQRGGGGEEVDRPHMSGPA